MSGPETTTAESAAAVPGRRPAIGSRSPGPSPRQITARRPWWIWAGPFALVLAGLVGRSRFLFTPSFYEQGGPGAHSIPIQPALHRPFSPRNSSPHGLPPPPPPYPHPPPPRPR